MRAGRSSEVGVSGHDGVVAALVLKARAKLLACALFSAGAVGCGGLERRILFPEPTHATPPALEGAFLLEDTTAQGDPVFALHVPAKGDAPTVVYFHGNGEQLADLRSLALALRRRGFGFFAVEYPGFGLAWKGSPSEPSLYRVADRALRWLRTDGHVSSAGTVLMGRSLGTGVAAEMASRAEGAALVLVSPYTSIDALFGHFLPVFGPLLVDDHFSTIDKPIRVPTLLVHGLDDRVIPARMSHELALAIPDVQVLWYAGRGHNDVLTEPMLDAIAAFAWGAAP